MSGSSFSTALAAAFMRSMPRRSFGFSKAYLSENLPACEKHYFEAQSSSTSLVKAPPVDSHYDPGVWQQQIGLLKSLHILIPVKFQQKF